MWACYQRVYFIARVTFSYLRGPLSCSLAQASYMREICPLTDSSESQVAKMQYSQLTGPRMMFERLVYSSITQNLLLMADLQGPLAARSTCGVAQLSNKLCGMHKTTSLLLAMFGD